ncbi:MAG: Rne/Rng family ribonuclease, partial [Gammaproteobacteria bacterium]|nr:Rne/Rng family ribonuclease [Gammaproteobacteria bacterium]
RLTTDLSIASRNMVYLPWRKDVGISQKIPSVTERARLISIVKHAITEHSLSGGFIIRTLAEAAQEQDIHNELAFLERFWKQILSALQEAPPASLVHEGLPLELRILRDLPGNKVAKIVIDSETGFQRAMKFIDAYVPELASKLQHYSKAESLFDRYAVEQAIQNALQRKVNLPSGGSLVVDQTEALTSVDVNTGAFTGRRDHQETLLKTNLEAAGAVAHQIKLRNLGGIIIIDFIDMEDHKHRRQVLKELASALSRDRERTRISEMSSLGLVEVTRQRTRASLAQIMCESCIVCEGRGMLKTAQTVCYEIFRELSREYQKFKARSYTIVAAPTVIELLLDQESTGLARLQRIIECPINLQVDQHYQQQQYDIALN